MAGGYPTIPTPNALAYSHDGKIWAGAGVNTVFNVVYDIAYNSSNWIAVGKNNNIHRKEEEGIILTITLNGCLRDILLILNVFKPSSFNYKFYEGTDIKDYNYTK